ncbi:hypothetical protein O0L34_g5452 [Tuta absoluta]|nr:hypothetical protein O0L34_g5452 [Tuta absoluta]
MAPFGTASLVFIIYVSAGFSSEIDIYPIAGLFDSESLESKEIFRKAAEAEHGTQSYVGRVIQPSVINPDTYSLSLEVCKNTTPSSNAVVAVIDARPTNGICDIICLLCNRLNIVHLSVDWEPVDTLADNRFTLSYYPPPQRVSAAFATLIRDLDWDRFTILYEDESSFVRLQEIIGSWSHLKDPITFRQLIPSSADSNRPNRETFKYILKTARITRHVLDCKVENIIGYMQEILEVENSTQYQSFILTNLDAHKINLSAVPNMMANISTFHMMSSSESDMQLKEALTKDALTHLSKALAQIQYNVSNDPSLAAECAEDAPPLCAENKEPWLCGEKLLDALAQVKINKGETGPVEIDVNGERTNFELNYAKIDTNGIFAFAGKWTSLTGVIMKEAVPDRSQTQSGVIRVIARKGMPYFNVTVDENGEDVPRGYAVDLITEIFKAIEEKESTLKFKLEFREVRDGGYGNPIEGSKKWNGIMGELMEHTADLGICDLTITSERNSVVDFSTPFMTTGISMLFKEPEPETPDQFSFIKPLSVDVWLYLATTYIIVSFLFLICARMSQLDWVNPHPCNQNPENLENIWSFYNCTWFAMGTIMTQGCDILPRGLGSRWIAGMWWFFAMIITASYTANMSAFLSNSRRSNDIKNAEDLANQNKVTYGAVNNASTYKFFQNSNDTTYAKIWQNMVSFKPTVFTKSNEEGRDRVILGKGKYAFFMESSMIKYYTERNCMLRMVGPPLDSKAYGIAMPKNFPHKKRIDEAIIQLQETRKLAELEIKWWKNEDNNGNCTKTTEEEEGEGLQMKNTAGIFLMLGVGGILGLVVAVIDFLIHANKIAVKEKVTFKEALLSEWNASLNPRTLAKPAAPPRSAAASSESPSPLLRERSTSRAVSVLRAASSFINFDEIY